MQGKHETYSSVADMWEGGLSGMTTTDMVLAQCRIGRRCYCGVRANDANVYIHLGSFLKERLPEYPLLPYLYAQ